MSTEFTDEHPAISLIRKYVDEGQFDPSAQQQAEQPAPAQEAAPQGPQAMDFAGSEGAAPQQAPAPTPQPAAQPAPQQAPQQNDAALSPPAALQHPQIDSLTPSNIASAYNQDMGQSADAYNKGIAQQANAATQSAGIKMAQNDIQTDALGQIAQADNEFQQTRNAIDHYHMNVTQQAVSDIQADTQKQMELLNANPHSFWGSTSTTGKIAGIIGMIGAGLSHTDASEYIQNIVNNKVAESDRKQRALGKLGDLHDKMWGAQIENVKNMSASADAQKSAAYQAIALQVKQQLAVTKNPQEVANLTKTMGDLQEKSAKHQEEGANNIVTHNLNALKTQLEIEKMNFDQRQAQTVSAPKPPEDPNKYLALGSMKGRGVQSVVYKEAADKISSSESVVANIEQARKLLSNPSVNSAYGLKQVNAQILSELRKLQGTGANLSPEEVKNIEALTPAWGDVVRGSLSLVDFNARLTAAQRLVAHSALNYVKNVGAPENELSDKSPLYNVMQGEQGEQQEMSTKQRAQSILDGASAAR